jgi:Fe-S cluster assembly protein SufB
MSTSTEQIDQVLERGYSAGFVTDIAAESVPPGLDESVIAFISAKKGEPQWLLDWRLKAYRHWLTMSEPTWAAVEYTPIDYQAISYYSAPAKKLNSLDEVDPELLKTYEKLGVPLHERAALAGVAVDAVFDGVHRRLVRLHPAGRALPDGAIDLLPDQRGQDRPVRADADHRRQG